jgi:acyl carrier protein
MTTQQRTTEQDRAEVTTRLLAQMVGKPPADLAEETRIVIDLGLTSVNILELLMRLEDELGIEFDGDTLD